MLGLRAALKRSSDAWADYGDVAVALSWFVPPLILVCTPLLIGQPGYGGMLPVVVSVLAIALFCIARAFFSPETLSVAAHARGLVSSFAAEVGVWAYLVGSSLTQGPQESALIPSARLFVSLLWWSYLGNIAVGYLLGLRGGADTTTEDLESGELRNRVKEIAAKHGVKLEHILLIRSLPGRGQCVNAVAVEGTTVALFADLVMRLRKSEVDTVVEHEVGHIADERLWSLDQTLRYGCYLALLALVYVTEKHITAMQPPWSSLIYVMWIGMFILPEVLSTWYSRRSERKANDAAAIVTDPMAAISGLYKIALLNHGPISRPLWSRLISTHPCIDEQVEKTAKRAGITDHQLRQTLEQAKREIAIPDGDRYQLGAQDDPGLAEGQVVEPIRRPTGWATLGVFVLTLAGSIGLGMAYAFILGAAHVEIRWWWFVLLCCLLVIAVPAVFEHRMWRRYCGAVIDRLAENYGKDAVDQSLLVDALFPDPASIMLAWQGTLLDVWDGKLRLRAETAEMNIPLDSKISVSRWADQNSSGTNARMVRIVYEQDNDLNAVLVRAFARPRRREPKNWRHLEKRVQTLIADVGVANTSIKDMQREHRRKRVWASRRVPAAIIIYLGLLGLGDFLARAMGEGGLGSRVIWLVVVTFIGGPGLWAWVTQAYKPDQDAQDESGARDTEAENLTNRQ